MLWKVLVRVGLLVIVLGTFFVFAPSTHAAILNVVAGTDGIEENSQCQLSEAIQNINDQTQTNIDCPAGDGNDDTITLPTGTITLTAFLPQITQSMTIQGQGMGETVINGDDGALRPFVINSGAGNLVTIQGLTITEYQDAAIRANGSDITLVDVEVTGGEAFSAGSGIFLENMTANEVNFTLQDVYVHDFQYTGLSSGSAVTPIGISGGDDAGIGVINFAANRVVVSDISTDSGYLNNFIIAIGAYTGFRAHTINAELSNITIDNIVNSSETGSASLVGISNTVASGVSTVNLNINNATLNGLRGGTGLYGPSFAFGGAGAGIGAGAVAEINAEIANVTLADNLRAGLSANCVFADYTSLFGGAGSTDIAISSLGGNISDDASCNSAFTHPADQTEVSGLADTLGPLSDNGGSVPTIPLLSGSPAIDAGVTVSGLTSDARGVTRPQCAASDSGAYEYNGTCPEQGNGPNSDADPIPDVTEDAAPNNGDGNGDGTPDSEQANVTSLPIPSGSQAGSYVTLVTPAGTTLTTTTIQQAATLATQDSVYDYPLGLVSFTVDDVTPGATIPVTLYFATTQSPDSFTTRKYKPSTQAFFDIPGAILTTEQVGSTPTLKLSYTLTDGGDLDDDQAANGTIVDPVGLATRAGLAETGENLWLYALGIIALLGSGVWMQRRAEQL